jgi:hypothetical protein
VPALPYKIAAILLTVPAAALAADAPEEWSPPRRGPYVTAPPPPTAFTEGEVCRVIVKRRLNEFGELVVRRIRICEEDGAAYPRHRWSGHQIPPRDIGRAEQPSIDLDDDGDPG